MSEWIAHMPTGYGRSLPSDTPIEVELRDGRVCRNRAGNFDNWRWRESGPDAIRAYRLIDVAALTPSDS
jgi:hypothetical protein